MSILERLLLAPVGVSGLQRLSYPGPYPDSPFHLASQRLFISGGREGIIQSPALPQASGYWRQDEMLAVLTATSFPLAHSLGVTSHTFVRRWNSFLAFHLEFLKLQSATHHFSWLISRPLITRYDGRKCLPNLTTLLMNYTCGPTMFYLLVNVLLSARWFITGSTGGGLVFEWR